MPYDVSPECSRLESALQKAVRSKRIPKDHVAILEAAALEVAELEHFAVAVGPQYLWWTSYLYTFWRQTPAAEGWD